jgi:hypothetical protein
MKKIATALVLASFLTLSPSFAAPCKDAKGKFMKCPPKAAAAPAKAARCRDAKGHFMKCAK